HSLSLRATTLPSVPDETEEPARTNAPVFVVGCPRSGTTLLYHMLLSAGRFVRFRSETHVFNTLAPRFGGLRTAADRQLALEVWLRSDNHQLTTLSDDAVRSMITTECRHAGDFLRLIMEAMGARQGMPRWAETTPDHVLYMPQIRDQIPGALFLHVVRDGRDVAASMARQGWIRPLPAHRERPALASAAYWQWVVERGRAAGTALGADYCEVRYEDLVDAPVDTLAKLGRFIGQPLDWDHIQRVGIGSVGKPNTSFPGAQGGFKGRWRTELPAADARDVDGMLARTLRTLGYESDSPGGGPLVALHASAYAWRFAARHWIKGHTPLGRRSTDLGFFAPGSMRVSDEKLRQAMPDGGA
ncbi:MAG: sulfotransferase, partial [Gemmatimonadaceae bacterium]